MGQDTWMDVARIQVELERLLGVTVDVQTPKALPDKFRGVLSAEAVALLTRHCGCPTTH